MKMNESEFRKYVRSEIKKSLRSNNSKKSDHSEQKVRRMVREAIRDVLGNGTKSRLDEAVMGMVDLPAINAGQVGRGEQNAGFSYNVDAVRDMARRDSEANRRRKDARTASRYSSSSTSSSPKPQKKETVNERITFLNEDTQDSIALWIENGSMVCETKTSEGTQRNFLSEEKTKKVVEYILSDSILNLND